MYLAVRGRGQTLLSCPLAPISVTIEMAVATPPAVMAAVAATVLGVVAVGATSLHLRRVIEDVESWVDRPGHGAALADVVMQHQTRRLYHALFRQRGGVSRNTGARAGGWGAKLCVRLLPDMAVLRQCCWKGEQSLSIHRGVHTV